MLSSAPLATYSPTGLLLLLDHLLVVVLPSFLRLRGSPTARLRAWVALLWAREESPYRLAMVMTEEVVEK